MMKAFPQAIQEQFYDHGMDLRDYFAAHSLHLAEQALFDNESFEDMAKFAYQVADAMMKAREQ